MGDERRLYLSKRDEIIFVDNIPQLYINCIRFLYRQFKKKNPGAIITDSTEYHKNLHVVLFLKAVHHLLKQPVLILCEEAESWMELFSTWTEFGDDVTHETEKPHLRKPIIINTMANLPLFCKRNWSMLIVDLPVLDKTADPIFGLPFNSDFKIWVTPIDMKENLDAFSKFYKWLHPKGDFNKEDYIADRRNPRDFIDKAIFLDAFMEDFVATVENIQEISPPLSISVPVASLKNKDSTGTKIKRSKIKKYDDDDIVPLIKTKNDGLSETVIAKESDDLSETVIGKENDGLSETVIGEENGGLSETVIGKENDGLSETMIGKENDGLSETVIGKENDGLSETVIAKENNGLSETVIAKESDDLSEIVIGKEKLDTIVFDSSLDSQVTLFYEPDSPKRDNSDILYEMDTQDLNEVSVNIEKPQNNIEVIDNYLEKENIRKEINLCEDEIMTEDINNVDSNQENNISLDQKSLETNEINLKINEVEKISAISDDLSNDQDNRSSKRDFDDKIKEIEEKAMKKFKGSIFDTLF